MSLEFTDTTLQTQEPLATFKNFDELGKSYVELHNKVATGDVSILPEDVRKDPTISNYKNIVEIAKGLIETKKLVGQIKKPPESPDKYSFTALQNLHKGLSDVPGTQKALAIMFHKAGLDNDKADQLQQMILTGLSTGFVKNDETRAVQAKEAETTLRSEWKENYDKNYGNVENVLKRIGLEDLVTDLKGNPKRLAGFHKLTSLLSEDSLGKLGEGGGGGKDTKSKEGAQARIKEIMNTPELRTILADGKNPKHKDMVKEWNQLSLDAYAT